MDEDAADAYLHRIGAGRPAVPDAAALRALHRAHLVAVPFENLSIHLGEDIVLDEEALRAKVVDDRRGGFCYELNGAFAALLRSLGFGVELLAARVFQGEGRLSVPYSHMALRVGTGDGARWLVDVGFGKHSEYPLRLDGRGEQHDPGGVFRIEERETGDLDLLRDGTPQYRMEQRPRGLGDFEGACWYNRTSPDSHFTRSLVCSRLTGDGGRITLSDRTLVTTGPGGTTRTERELPPHEVLPAYRTHFGLTLRRAPDRPAAPTDR